MSTDTRALDSLRLWAPYVATAKSSWTLRQVVHLHRRAGFAQISGLLAEAAVAAQDVTRLKAWWFYRMLFGPDPLGEKLTLLWHNHFATSNIKVDDLAAMRRQNETFRKLARAPFGTLLEASFR